MSVHALSWAFKQPIENAGAKFVLVALANFADESGHCFPSQTRLARETGLGVRTVRRHIQWLEDNGWIEKARRRRNDGSWSSDSFMLITQRPNRPEAKVTEGQKEHPPAAKNDTPAANLADHEPSLEPSEEPSCTKRASYPDDFEAFWKEYPSAPNQSKKDALKAWKKAKRQAPAEQILVGVRAYRELLRKNPDRPVAHASTWLDGARWEAFEVNGVETCETVVVRQGTPQWDAWKLHRQAEGKKFMPEALTVAAEWPPSNHAD